MGSGLGTSVAVLNRHLVIPSRKKKKKKEAVVVGVVEIFIFINPSRVINNKEEVYAWREIIC
jgi:hypothetical protein